ncbi:MAG: hypothetical protein U5K33_04115 [Halofilum sp. (in: g-proteobacteria)]|nr:hypothetical protein [Halofilum sp. (in: g-proteobacteria)]
MQLAIQGGLVLLGLGLLIAFLRLFTRSGLESRVRTSDGGGSGHDAKHGASRTSRHGANTAAESRIAATGHAVSEE